jgi:chromosomal replication initiator protein
VTTHDVIGEHQPCTTQHTTKTNMHAEPSARTHNEHASHDRTSAGSAAESASADRTGAAHAPSDAQRVIDHLSEAIGPERVRRLLGTKSAVSCEGDALEIRMPDRFSAEMIERRLGEDLRRAVAAVIPGRAIEVRVRVAGTASNSPAAGEQPLGIAPPAARQGGPRAQSQQEHHRQGVPEYIVGEPNRMAFEACRRAACEHDGPQLVFVHGPCGVGKTHLLRQAGSMCRRANRDARIRITTGEGFIGGYVRSSLEKSVLEFQRKHRKLDLLIIDDVHVIAGKEGTQQELVRTLSELQLMGSRVIVASDAHPREIAKLQAALASRFVSGVVAPVGRPDEDMVRRLIPALAKRRGLVLDPRGLDLLTARVLEDELATVRDIEGTLTQVQAMGNLMDKDRALFLSAEHVRKAVEMRAGSRAGIRSGPVGMDAIINAACAELGVTKADLSSKGRAKKVVLAREVIVHLGKRHTGRSYPELAMALGRPNHSTVITAHQRFEGKLASAEPIKVGAAIDGCSPGELIGRLERAMGV